MTSLITIKETALYYHNLGITIIPFFINPQANPSSSIHDKQPNIREYKQWNERLQTDEEFNALDWTGCNGFGLILGQKNKDGKYLAVIDFDPKLKKEKLVKVVGKIIAVPLTPEDIQHHEEKKLLAEKILAEFPTTKKELTVNYGTHLFYLSKVQPSIDGTFHDETLIELLGNKKLCVMYPSFGYKNIGSDLITEVEDIEQLFHTILKNHGFTKNEQTEVENQVDNYSFKIEKIIDLSKLENKGNGCYQGSHPIHDSTTEANFSVDTKHNQWHCFRCNSGGGALQYLAMKEGIISCEQAKKGALRGKKFQETLKLAVANGLIDEKVLDQAEINPIILAKDIMEDHIFVVDKDTDELFYYVKDGKDEGIYSNQTEQIIRREITTRLDENFKARYKNEITEFILGTAPLIEMGNSDPELLAIKEGILNLKTKTVEKYDSKHHITNKLQVTFKETDCHVWKDFIEKVIPSEKQRKQTQQLVGHCLYGKILVEICTVFLGGGSNGKTIFLQTLTKFLGGSKNVSSHSIQALCYDKFTTGEVKGKLANICADLPHKELMNTANFKALTSGDSMQAYIKHVQKTASFLPTTKYIFSANQIPPVTVEEDCFAWYRRFLFIDFPMTFTPANSTPRQELLASLSKADVFSEILNWAVEGLQYLLEHGDVSEKPTTEEIRLIYIKRSDSALAYFEDKVECTDNPDDFVFTDKFHRDYVTYCHANGLKPKTQGDFVNIVKQHLPGAEKTRIRPEYVYEKGTPKPSPLSAFRYIKVDFSVPDVPSVPTSGNNRAKIEKFKQSKISNLDGIVSKASTPDTFGTQTQEKEILHFNKVEPNNIHQCSKCKALEAVYQQDKGYFCQDCFKELRTLAEKDGCEFFEDKEEDEEIDDRNYGDEFEE
jgi:P4 family phage/plasmid primase-like protien